MLSYSPLHPLPSSHNYTIMGSHTHRKLLVSGSQPTISPSRIQDFTLLPGRGKDRIETKLITVHPHQFPWSYQDNISYKTLQKLAVLLSPVEGVVYLRSEAALVLSGPKRAGVVFRTEGERRQPNTVVTPYADTFSVCHYFGSVTSYTG